MRNGEWARANDCQGEKLDAPSFSSYRSRRFSRGRSSIAGFAVSHPAPRF